MRRISHREGAVTAISRCDRVLSSRMTCRILASTGSGELIFKLLDFGQASFDLEAVSLFPCGMYKGGRERAHRLGVQVNCFSL